MKIKLDGIYSPDLPSGYAELPDEPENCWVVINADIGLDDGNSSTDCFTFYITTPQYLGGSLSEVKHQFGCGLIILESFDWFVVESAIMDLCAKIKVKSWDHAVQELSRYGFYEFDNMS